LAWGYHLIFVGMPPAVSAQVALSVMAAAVNVASFVLIRKGHFRAAVVTYIAGTLIVLAIAYGMSGSKQMTRQTNAHLPLIISGLILGRRALWLTYASVLAAVAIGCAIDARQLGLAAGFYPLGSAAIALFVLAIMIDRAVAALRESLAESNQRGRDLQREMAERERAQSQLIHAQKMEATGRLASGIAHDAVGLPAIDGDPLQRLRGRSREVGPGSISRIARALASRSI
jgi:hypothetical protein